MERFANVESSVIDFIDQQKNKNTVNKTSQDINLLLSYLNLKNEIRNIEDIPSNQLNEYLSEFFITVRKKNNQEYEPTSLRSILASIERYLKEKNYGKSLLSSPEFNTMRSALKSKQKDLKRKGKGNKPNAAEPLTTSEIVILHEKRLLGCFSGESLLNTMWLNNTTHFGLRGCSEHREMTWGDVTLKRNCDGIEYLEFSERQTKTRSGDNLRDTRVIKPKMFSTADSTCIDPVEMYKIYADKRPTEMNNDDSPFYLAVNTKSNNSDKSWFKKSPVGINKLNTLMAAKAGLTSRLTNHSGRKTMIQTLAEQNVPPTRIVQLSGHKNLQSVNNYAKVSELQQLEMSRIISGTLNAETSVVKELTYSENCVAGSSGTQKCGSIVSFSGATITGSKIDINVHPASVPKTRKRVIYDSSSDSE